MKMFYLTRNSNDRWNLCILRSRRVIVFVSAHSLPREYNNRLEMTCFLFNFAAYIVCRRLKQCEFLGFVRTDCWGGLILLRDTSMRIDLFLVVLEQEEF